MTIGQSSVTLVSNNGQHSRRLPQYVAALCATFGGFIMGTVLAWTSPVSPKLAKEYFPVTDLQSDFIGGIVSIGAIFGALLEPTICSRLGWKGGIIFLTLPGCVGWALLIWAKMAEMILVGRFILGAVAGGLTVACPLYTAEIGENAIRGTLGMYFPLQVTSGIFFDYVVGNNVNIFWFNVICAILPIVLAVLMMFMPESPMYYLVKRNEAAAIKSLQWLRGKKYNTAGEIEIMKASIEKVEEEKLSFREAFSTKPAKRGLLIGVGLMFFQQFSGINGVIFYSSDIFESAGASLSPANNSMIIGAVSVVAIYLSTLAIDRLGRKPLLIFSNTITALSSGVLGLYFYLRETKYDVSQIGWLPVTSVSIFIIVYSLGVGPIPWLIVGEIFPPGIKGPASSIACVFNWVFSFIITFGFTPVCRAIHQSSTFWGFAVITAFGAVFAIFIIPETKSKSLDEIQKGLGGTS